VVVPTKRSVQADRANSNDDATEPHAVGEEEAKHLWTFPQAELPQHIGSASVPSKYDEALGQLHLPAALVQE
jgi:hypothetical protein